MKKPNWHTLAWLTYFVTLFFLTFFVTQSVFAAEINCYSGKVRIYHGFGEDFVFSTNFVSFTEYKTEHLILVSADCIILTPILRGDKFHAIDVGQDKYFA